MRLWLALLVALWLPARAHAQQAAAPEAKAAASDDDDRQGDDGSGDEAAEAESETAEDGGGSGLRYSSDLSDEELARRFKADLESLGTISVGFADQGRLINAVHMPEDPAFMCQRPDLAWGTRETVDSLVAAFRAVHTRFPESGPARLSHIGARDGGYLRPHKSHQSGRDADIGFFYKNDQAPGARARREKFMDLPRNWTLIKSLVMLTDVQVILVDRGVQKILRDYALQAGEDQLWVDRIFRAGKHALVQHARRHKDHFHVRFYSPRSQELGRRIQPLLALRPEQNLAVIRVKRGQTLGHLAKAYGTSVVAIQRANRMRGTFLHLDQRVMIPLRKPCTKCPLPPAVVVPERVLPEVRTAAAPDVASATLGVAP